MSRDSIVSQRVASPPINSSPAAPSPAMRPKSFRGTSLIWWLAIGSIAVTTLLNLRVLIMNVDPPSAWDTLIGPRSQYGIPALIVTVVLALTGMRCLRLARNTSRESTSLFVVLAWNIVGGALIVAGLLDVTHAHEYMLHGRLAVALPVLLGLPLVGAVAVTTGSVWPCQRARAHWLIGIALLATNPATEAWKLSLSSEPENYNPVANDTPWRFSTDAWRELHAVELLQETTEAAAAFLILSALVTADQRRSSEANDR